MNLSDEERGIVVELDIEKARTAYNETILADGEKFVEWCRWAFVLCSFSRCKRTAYTRQTLGKQPQRFEHII